MGHVQMRQGMEREKSYGCWQKSGWGLGMEVWKDRGDVVESLLLVLFINASLYSKNREELMWCVCVCVCVCTTCALNPMKLNEDIRSFAAVLECLIQLLKNPGFPHEQETFLVIETSLPSHHFLIYRREKESISLKNKI